MRDRHWWMVLRGALDRLYLLPSPIGTTKTLANHHFSRVRRQTLEALEAFRCLYILRSKHSAESGGRLWRHLKHSGACTFCAQSIQQTQEAHSGGT